MDTILILGVVLILLAYSPDFNNKEKSKNILLFIGGILLTFGGLGCIINFSNM